MKDSHSKNDAISVFAKFLIVIPIVAVLLVPGCFVTGWVNGSSGVLPAPEGPPDMFITGDPSAPGKLATFAKRVAPLTPPQNFEYVNRGGHHSSGEGISKLSPQSHTQMARAGRVTSGALRQLAHRYEATGEYDKAYNALSQALAICSNDKLASRSDVEATLTDMVRCKLNAWKVFDAASLQGTKSGYGTFSNVLKQLQHVDMYSSGGTNAK